MDRTTAKRMLGSVFISLPLMFILTALKFYGVPGEGIGELCFLGAWLVGVAGIVFSEWLWERAVCDKVFVGISIAIIWGLSLYSLNNWAMAHRPEAIRVAGATEAPMPAPAPPANPKPSTAKPRQPRPHPPSVYRAPLSTPQLSPNTPPAQPVARPQAPTYIPVPTPAVSPYRELQNEVDEANNMVQLWTGDLATAQQSKRQRYDGTLSPKAREERTEAAEQLYRELVIRADERGIERWHGVASAVKKAHSDAIARMSQPGPKRLTPNQINKDEAEFEGLSASMERRTVDPNNPDKHRYEPLLDYL